MLQEILEAIRCREEQVEAFGKQFIVREITASAVLSGDAETEKMLAAAEEKGEIARDDLVYWRVFVRSIVEAGTGLAPFSLADIPALEKGSRNKLRALVQAVNRVNGLDAADNAKNSKAVQA